MRYCGVSGVKSANCPAQSLFPMGLILGNKKKLSEKDRGEFNARSSPLGFSMSPE